jgi:hypothetical protein
MATPRTLTTWTAAELPYAVHYAPEALEQIRVAVSSSAGQPASFGGSEVGGILLGRHSEDAVTISTSAFFNFRHVHGFGFDLKEQDRAGLAKLLDDASKDPETQPVGWFRCVHGELSFSPTDQALHLRFFPQRWQMLLLLKPDKVLPTRAAFFFLNCGSALLIGRRHEFALNPAPLSAEQQPPDSVPPEPSAAKTTEPAAAAPDCLSDEPAGVVAAAPVSEAPEAPPATPETATAPIAPLNSDLTLLEEPSVAGLVEDDSGDNEDEIATREHPDDDEYPGRSGLRLRIRRVAVFGLAVVVSAAIFMLGYATRHVLQPRFLSAAATQPDRKQGPSAPASMRLVTIEENGQLQILWDPSFPVVQQSSGGSLRITDGAQSQTFALDSTQLQTGSFTYTRDTQRVDIVLTVQQRSGNPLVQATTYVAKRAVGSESGSATPAGDDALGKEVTRLRSAFEAQQQRADRLQQTLERTRRELDRQRQRRSPPKTEAK